MLVVGLSAFYHDSAAAIVRDGRVIAAAQEERFSRRRHDAGFPHQALDYCLREAGVRLAEVNQVVFYEKPFLKFERLLETFVAFAPRGFAFFNRALPPWLKEKLFLKSLLCRELESRAADIAWHQRLLFTEHHLAHAASAFYPSPFPEAAVLTLDGVGEWTTTSLAVGRGRHLEILKEIHFPHSLGLLYSAFTYYLGFRVNSGEYKVMGLAPYGTPRYAKDILEHLIDLKDDGSFRLNMDYFDFCTGLTMTGRRFDARFGGPPRQPEAPIEQRHMDLAASVQAVIEEAMLRLSRNIAKETGMRHLCLAGGVALNVVANGKIWRDGQFSGLWIQPAAGDAGGALGAALAGYHLFGAGERQADGQHDAMQGSYLGPGFSQPEIEARLAACGAHFEVHDEAALLRHCAAALADGKVLGWFQGRMEFGPRALGGRSILADPRAPAMQALLNHKVKRRESFRPFAPSVLREHAAEWFDLAGDSPYMLLVAPVRDEKRRAPGAHEQELSGLGRLDIPRSAIPAVTHVDYSARVHTVTPETAPRYHGLIDAFHRLTGCPVLVNTSFNVRGEPIVCTPEEAFRCFMGTELDLLAVGNFLLHKAQQPPGLAVANQERFAPD